MKKQRVIIYLWLFIFGASSLVPPIDSGIFFAIQCLWSLLLVRGLIKIDEKMAGGHEKQIKYIISITAIFCLYNLMALIQYQAYWYWITDSTILFDKDNYKLVSWVINGLELLVIAFYTLRNVWRQRENGTLYFWRSISQ